MKVRYQLIYTTKAYYKMGRADTLLHVFCMQMREERIK